MTEVEQTSMSQARNVHRAFARIGDGRFTAKDVEESADTAPSELSANQKPHRPEAEQ